mmetsp:Transcript_8519/g.10618  ORF Transcript_8519/g.10618 Transcript_8519/m.10618 type:complete len:501 (-) Transcript_8519:334-1836(-)
MSRRPGFNERSYICRNTNKHYTNFNLTVKLNQRLTPELLSHALKALIIKNSWFTLNFYRLGTKDMDGPMNGENFEVRKVKSIRFEDVVTFKTIDSTFDSNILEEVNELICSMNEPFLPLWRIIVFENKFNPSEQFICFYCDHAVFDGIAGLEFQKELLRELSNSSNSKDGLELVSVLFENDEASEERSLEIDKAREEILNIFDVPFYYWIMDYFKSSLFCKWVLSSINCLRKSLTLFKGPLAQTLDPYDLDLLKHTMFRYKPISRNLSTKYKVLSFNNEEVKKMTSFCKMQGLTLTPYFNIIALQCLQETVFTGIKEPKKQMFSTSSCIAINGRRYYNFPKFLYGTLTGAEILNFGSMPPFSNKIHTIEYMNAAYLKLSASLRNKNSFLAKGLQRKTNFWSFYSDRIGKLEGKSTLVVSNLGVVKNKEDSEWKIEDVWFGLNTGSLYHFILNLITTEGKGLNLVFCYAPEYENLYNGNNEKLVDEMVKILRKRVLQFPDM